jgi:hypothetical protein
MRTTLLLFLVAACGNNNSLNQTTDDMTVDESDMSVGPDQGSMSCDLIQQDCPNGQKCAVSGFGMTATVSCVMAGTVTDGMACVRGMMGAPDNCAAGLTCSRGTCRKYCTADGDCDAGQKCGANRNTMLVGTCTPACTPFGNDCGAQNCSTLVTAFGSGGGVFFTCRMPGNTANFDDCTGGGASCGPDAFCDQNAGWCAPLCDDTHPCPAMSADGGVALSCMSLGTTMSGDPGYCSQ